MKYATRIVTIYLASSQGLQIGDRPRGREGLVSTTCVYIINMRIEICTDSIATCPLTYSSCAKYLHVHGLKGRLDSLSFV